MPDTMTSHERFARMFAHRDADRIPIVDGPWGSTVARWRREGLPENVSPAEYFGYDLTAGVGGDNSPRYPTKVIEETDRYVISTSSWGATLKNWKHSASVPDFLDFTIKDRETWADAKARMVPTRDRVDWDYLKQHYDDWHARGFWINGGLWFGYDVFASWHVGTERILIALIEDPEWCMDMFNHSLDVSLKLLEMIWDEGYRFDAINFPDDLGYRNGPFFSPATYRKVLKPIHKRAFDWAHDRGIYTMMHSCGNIMALVPDLVEIGLDSLNPLEVKAGMDVIRLKREFGDELVLEGNIDVRAMSQPDLIEEEIRSKITVAKVNGGYIYHSDHSVPDNVSFEDYKRVMALVRKYGTY